jgi:hypothetical protein
MDQEGQSVRDRWPQAQRFCLVCLRMDMHGRERLDEFTHKISPSKALFGL